MLIFWYGYNIIHFYTTCGSPTVGLTMHLPIFNRTMYFHSLQVRVPYKVVGLVVGPKGATIKRIQHQTNTYIVTPSRDKEPVFEVTGKLFYSLAIGCFKFK